MNMIITTAYFQNKKSLLLSILLNVRKKCVFFLFFKQRLVILYAPDGMNQNTSVRHSFYILAGLKP